MNLIIHVHHNNLLLKEKFFSCVIRIMSFHKMSFRIMQWPTQSSVLTVQRLLSKVQLDNLAQMPVSMITTSNTSFFITVQHWGIQKSKMSLLELNLLTFSLSTPSTIFHLPNPWFTAVKQSAWKATSSWQSLRTGITLNIYVALYYSEKNSEVISYLISCKIDDIILFKTETVLFVIVSCFIHWFNMVTGSPATCDHASAHRLNLTGVTVQPNKQFYPEKKYKLHKAINNVYWQEGS